MPKKFRTVGGRSSPKRSGYAKGMTPRKRAVKRPSRGAKRIRRR